MTILDTIVVAKKEEVATKKKHSPIVEMEKSPYFKASCYSLKEHIKDPSKHGIIAEFKRRSPSKGIIHEGACPKTITQGYIQAGASVLSVLTDHSFFGAQENDFSIARESNSSPILRKEFIIDEYQVIESKAMGADAILLIAKILTVAEIKKFAGLAKNLGMEVFLETHNEQEVRHAADLEVDLIGINNRNLNTFEVDVENSIRLAQQLPPHVLKIAESGISSVPLFNTLKENGFDGFLIGEYFMRDPQPAEKCKSFIQSLAV